MNTLQNWAHLCVDMQSLFAGETSWHVPWLNRTLPALEELVAMSAARTVFTRFIPPNSLEDAQGRWQNYYALWPDMLANRLPPGLLDLVPSLNRFVPPARVFDKSAYSPWWSGELHRTLRSEGVTHLAISGGETDVCVLATTLGAIDLGYHVHMVADALFGSADPTHDATLEIYRSRFQAQLAMTSVDELHQLWREGGL